MLMESTEIASKTKELKSNMSEVIVILSENAQHRENVESVSSSLKSDGKILENELSKFIS